LLTGCSTVVVGAASRDGDVVTDMTPQDFPITPAVDSDPVDQAVRNSLTDLDTFWVFPNTAPSGLELLRAFRAGFAQGGSQCYVGL
jgi:hypothetical protein